MKIVKFISSVFITAFLLLVLYGIAYVFEIPNPFKNLPNLVTVYWVAGIIACGGFGAILRDS